MIIQLLLKMKNITVFIACTIFLQIFISCHKENQDPTCTIKKPNYGEEFYIGEIIEIVVNATDLDGEIYEVRFYLDEVELCVLNYSPYRMEWDTKLVSKGIHTIKAVCYDDVNSSSSYDVSIKLKQLNTEGNPCPGNPTMIDIDGNIYNTVQIGYQCWMKENLKVTHYPNGDAIPIIWDENPWMALDDNNIDDALSLYYDNYYGQYGVIYSYSAAIADNWQRDKKDSQGICPDGWHLPTDVEWKILEGTVDTEFPVGHSEWEGISCRGFDAGMHLKSDIGWYNNGSGDNSSGFCAIPDCRRQFDNGVLYGGEFYGSWWTATTDSAFYAWNHWLSYDYGYANRSRREKSNGYSVRCVMDYEQIDN